MCQPLRISSTEIKMDSQNPASRLALPTIQQSKAKTTFRFSPFRKIAKTTRINLNRYWGLLSKINISKNGSNSDALYAEEIEQNRINELLEAQIHATSQNSINSQVEESYKFYYYNDFSPISSGYGSPILSSHSETSTPPPARKLVRPTPTFVKCSCSSSECSMDFDETSSQDSLFL